MARVWVGAGLGLDSAPVTFTFLPIASMCRLFPRRRWQEAGLHRSEKQTPCPGVRMQHTFTGTKPSSPRRVWGGRLQSSLQTPLVVPEPPLLSPGPGVRRTPSLTCVQRPAFLLGEARGEGSGVRLGLASPGSAALHVPGRRCPCLSAA